MGSDIFLGKGSEGGEGAGWGAVRYWGVRSGALVSSKVFLI